MKVYKEKAGELLMLLLPLFGSDPDRLIAVDRYSYERKITTFRAWVLLFLHYLRVRTLALSRVDRSLSRTKNTGVDDRLKALPRWNAECKLVVLRRSSPFICLCNIVCCMVCRYDRGFFQNICER